MSLRPCPSCARHVRASESACPFCKTALPELAAEASVSPARAVPRVGRAAIFAFGAMATAGCDGGVAPAYGTPVLDAGGPDAFVGTFDAAYGGPPFDASLDATTVVEDAPSTEDAAFDGGGGGNLYGGPPLDASNGEDTGGAVPLYGGAGF